MSDRSIAETVRYLAGTHQIDVVTLLDATVETVDIPSRTCLCTAITGPKGSELPDVRLMPIVDDGMLLVPSVGSTVTILYSIFTAPIIIGYTQLDKIVFQGGDLGGLPQILPLIVKLNNLENLVNDLIAKYNLHTHGVVSVGSPTSQPLVQESGTLTPTVRADLENVNITQG